MISLFLCPASPFYLGIDLRSVPGAVTPGASFHLRGAPFATDRASPGVAVGHLLRNLSRAANVAGQVNFLIPK